MINYSYNSCRNRKFLLSNAGMTLLEVMIAVGIIGVLVGLATPSFEQMIHDYRLRGATMDIASCFQEMKLRAIKENKNALVFFDVAANKYTAFVDFPANGTYEKGTDDIISEQNLPNGVFLYRATTFSANTFGFTSRGLPVNNQFGTVFINNSHSRYKQVSVSMAGNIKVRQSSDGVTWN